MGFNTLFSVFWFCLRSTRLPVGRQFFPTFSPSTLSMRRTPLHRLLPYRRACTRAYFFKRFTARTPPHPTCTRPTRRCHTRQPPPLCWFVLVCGTTWRRFFNSSTNGVLYISFSATSYLTACVLFIWDAHTTFRTLCYATSTAPSSQPYSHPRRSVTTHLLYGWICSLVGVYVLAFFSFKLRYIRDNSCRRCTMSEHLYYHGSAVVRCAFAPERAPPPLPHCPTNTLRYIFTLHFPYTTLHHTRRTYCPPSQHFSPLDVGASRVRPYGSHLRRELWCSCRHLISTTAPRAYPTHLSYDPHPHLSCCLPYLCPCCCCAAEPLAWRAAHSFGRTRYAHTRTALQAATRTVRTAVCLKNAPPALEGRQRSPLVYHLPYLPFCPSYNSVADGASTGTNDASASFSIPQPYYHYALCAPRWTRVALYWRGCLRTASNCTSATLTR